MDKKLKRALAAVQKPGRYTGGEPNCVYKNKENVDLRFAFCFPDTYEIGMSFLGMKILYEILNSKENIWCERAFMPWTDMMYEMKKSDIPLYALESKDELLNFDVVGFTLQYELSYTNILAMLDLANIPFYAKDRAEDHPIIVAGGPCACNAEPIADFIDLIMLGEGEEQLLQVCNEIIECKKKGFTKKQTLLELSKIKGVYIPSFYEVSYKEDGTIEQIKPTEDVPKTIEKAIIIDMDKQPMPENFIVPMIGAVHDRAQIEVLRGCVRGCRFCQAGFIYRPMRERSAEVLSKSGQVLCENTGYDEISLTSLSTSDHSQLEPLLDSLLDWSQKDRVSLSLPSLRIDNFSQSLVEKTTKIRKSGLTFAPEAGTQRLRDVINKNITQENIETSCKLAFASGYTSVKLYFMLGLPTETDDDVVGIAETARRVIDLYFQTENKPKGKNIHVSVSVACFVPKPHTPFQYCPQDSLDRLHEKQQLLLSSVKSKKINVSYHDGKTSFLEAVFAKGDRKLAKVIEKAYRDGCYFDGWYEHFKYETWLKAFEELNIDMTFYANRQISTNEILPWSHLKYGVSDEFLVSEYEKAVEVSVTQPCNKVCSNCGANKLLGGACFGYN